LRDARDQAQPAARPYSRFLAMVSHEIRTPLNGILGLSDLLLDTELSPEQATYAGAINRSGELLLGLVEEVLDFSKIEAGKLVISARAFDLAALIEETVELIAPRAQAKRLDVAYYVDDKLPRMVVGDPARLRQILLNLAANAVKFTQQGGIAVTVDCGGSHNEVRFSVRDTGIGIAPEAQARIFLEFEQADDGPGRQFGGTGLGLAICNRIVEQMGGRIGVESTPGAGSVFEFLLPLPAAPNQPQRGEAPKLAGAEILIVAPTFIGASLLGRTLTDWGARTCLVSDFAAATQALAQRQWPVIILDVDAGINVAEQLATQTPESTLRIVLVTPSMRHALPGFKRAGFGAYLVKPIRTASLARALASQLNESQPKTDFPDEPTQLQDQQLQTRMIESPGNGLAVLIAEDNEINALLAQALLSKLGHRVTLVSTGAAAFDAWAAADAAGQPYDLLLMDVQMPGGTGLDATRRIRAAELERGRSRRAIFALTANAFEEDHAACIASGMDGVLTKPLHRDRLLDIIAKTSPAPCIAA
jgi:CheY-like chemotaxis protein/two-component sensor histidine kinase